MDLNRWVNADEPYYIGHCPRRYHDNPEGEFVIYPSRNVWYCHCESCEEHYPVANKGDLLDLHRQINPKAKKPLQELIDLYYNNKPFDNSEFDPDIPKWDKSKLGWEGRPQGKAIKQDKISQDAAKYGVVSSTYFPVEVKPIVSTGDLGLHIYLKMFYKPEWIRVLSSTTNRTPFICDEGQLLRRLYGSSISRLGFMTGAIYKTREGGRHGYNVLDRLYICVDFDEGPDGKPIPYEIQLRLFAYLKMLNLLPLVAIVDSRGKSYHGIFCCIGASIETLEKFEREAIELFCDARVLRPNCYFRLPNGTRFRTKEKPGYQILPPKLCKRQTVLYFDETAINNRY